MKEYNFKINGNDYTVGIEILNDTEADVIVNGRLLFGRGARHDRETQRGGQTSGGGRSRFASRAAFDRSGYEACRGGSCGCGRVARESPLPGVILDIRIKEGDTVAVGQTLVVLEAMKMENNIDSDRAGVVKSIKVNRGDPCWRATCS